MTIFMYECWMTIIMMTASWIQPKEHVATFLIEEVRELSTTVGLEVLQLEYITRIFEKKSGKNDTKNGGAVERRRIWLHGRFRKPCA